MTELNGCVAQSQNAHDTTCLRGTTRSSSGRLASGPMACVLAVGGGVGTPFFGSVMSVMLLP